MPSTLIEVRREYSPAEEIAIIDAVQGALVAAFRIPLVDRNVRLVSHAPHRFAVNPTLTRPECFTFIAVDCFAGRSLDAKRRLYQEIVDRLAALGIPRDHIVIALREITEENWGIRAGHPASEVELGYDVRV